ncbi:hypothetical protein ACWGKU_31845 [Kitasatospora sp. NPDC054768]
MADPPEQDPDHEIRKWSVRIGLAASAVTILTWLGIADWNDLKAKITGTPASSAAPARPPTYPAPVVTRTAVRGPAEDPACQEAEQAISAYTSSTAASGASAVARLRAYAEGLDVAASHAVDPRVRAAIRAMAADERLAAADLDVADFAAFRSDSARALSDMSAVYDACSASAS